MFKTRLNKTSTNDRNTLRILILAILALAVRIPLVFRNYSLGTDDGIYAISARHVAKGNIPFRNVFSSQGGWFLEILALPVYVARNVFWFPRIVPVIAGIAITILTYKIALKLMNNRWAFVAALFTAVSGTIIRTTSAITSDGIVVAFSLLCILLAMRFVEDETDKNALYLGLALGFGCSIKSIFMIPTIIFLIVYTFRTTLRARALVLVSSLVVFIIPFIIFGFKNVWNQSVVYHLEKNDPRDLGANIAKIFTTIFKFDAFLTIVMVFVILMIGFLLFRKGKPKGLNRNIQLLTIAYFLPTILLLLTQTPIFRNHVVLIAPIIILIVTYTLSEHINLERPEHFAYLGVLMLYPLIFSGVNLYTDSAFRKPSGYDSIRETIVYEVKKDKIMLTNDPGFAFDTHQDVPLGLEDTSKYRFLSKNPALELNDETFSKYLKDKNVCTIVLNTKTKERQFDIEDKLTSDWSSDVGVEGDYKIWERSSEECLLPIPEFYEPFMR